MLLAKYKKWIRVSRHDRLMKKAEDPELKNVVTQLYRPGTMIGDGGTTSVLKFEKATGLGIAKHGKLHTIYYKISQAYIIPKAIEN